MINVITSKASKFGGEKWLVLIDLHNKQVEHEHLTEI